jgi:hypothetical protein
MRILVTIPHYFGAGGRHGSLGGDARRRLRAFAACLSALHGLFGRPQCAIDIAGRTTHPANTRTAGHLDIVVCTTGGRHLLTDLPAWAGAHEHHPTEAEPPLLGFECQAVLRERLGSYDYYCYLEDDLVLHDPWFFVKLAWFTDHAGGDRLLQPNRYECGDHAFVRKAYIDGDLDARVTAPFQDVTDSPRVIGTVMGESVVFGRALNPHAGCYFLSAAQMAHWAGRPFFLDRDTHFIGPLESAATLGIMRAFKVYKPAPEHAAFLEVEHADRRFLRLIRR